MMWNFYVLFRLSAEMEGGFETVFKATFLRTLKSLKTRSSTVQLMIKFNQYFTSALGVGMSAFNGIRGDYLFSFFPLLSFIR